MESSSEQIIYYASVFSLFPKEKATYVGYKPSLEKYESDGALAKGSNFTISKLLALSIQDQKEQLDDRQDSQPYIKVLFEIVKNVHGDEKLISWALLYLEGMLEENRNRIENLVAIQNSFNQARKMDLIGILLNFLISNSESKSHNRSSTNIWSWNL